jgi:uncharacterized membrane protein YdbT with pleckstrin-like domain
MSYIKTNLLKNEHVVYITQMHWIIFGTPVALLAVAVIFSLFGPHLFPGVIPFSRIRLSTVIILVCLVSAIFAGINALIQYLTSEYGVTNKRVMMKTGWISRDSVEVFIDRLEAMHVMQSILGRIFDYGTLVITGVGGTQDIFHYVPRPLNFRRIAQDQITHHEPSPFRK